MSEAFYLPTSRPGIFQATEATVGPWNPKTQHGGPPAALLARACETTEQAWPGAVVRMAVEILGPVPVGAVAVSAAVVRSGRSVELVEAEIASGGRAAVRARAWRIREAQLDLPATVPPAEPAPPMPDADDPPLGWGGFVQQLQTRSVAGRWEDNGPATIWARQRIPLVAGEEPSGLQRLMALADCGNGVSNTLPFGEWVFINPDLTVHLERYPRGEWLCIEAATAVDAAGFGLARSTLYDVHGTVARGAQSLYVSPR